jgi:hypothetical protein
VQDWLFLAMTEHRRGNAGEAKKWLARAAAAPPVTGDNRFWEKAEIELLRSEAEALLPPKK